MREYILCLIIIIKSEVWTIIYCLGLGHETMVCSLCLSIFLWHSRVINIPLQSSPHYGLPVRRVTTIQTEYIRRYLWFSLELVEIPDTGINSKNTAMIGKMRSRVSKASICASSEYMIAILQCCMISILNALSHMIRRILSRIRETFIMNWQTKAIYRFPPVPRSGIAGNAWWIWYAYRNISDV